MEVIVKLLRQRLVYIVGAPGISKMGLALFSEVSSIFLYSLLKLLGGCSDTGCEHGKEQKKNVGKEIGQSILFPKNPVINDVNWPIRVTILSSNLVLTLVLIIISVLIIPTF